MAAHTEHKLVHRQRAEAAALAEVISRLEGQFPEVGRQAIEQIVHGRRSGFENSVVRDFVPILVERSARKELALEVQGLRA